ncbi:phosphoribosyltransferase [Halomonas sp. MCCC 1A17488]|uniref:Phosphoribosyltransferase n=1 Tax=Billgrantia sulfidoxydans TaxID=2733484 RepID=A0ABX7W976_9GAMM|nr:MULTISPECIES: phosphoribosyltransferase family protein [Halomonas]MCE8017565.1 phosphoribosyltransferase [Halomonas sp. MCCC 1A17488]MCG3240898.1 phosphoribosyltransferase [Halomonas sp. MCCC 1A17488]QPP48770.1 phosphoribosyltransferase [Halomonas sp. SS10-MC5]QTP56107.1 phosphoribosyltransferase [Halomonas sulfidoxydans]
MFRDRLDAAELLAERLAHLKGSNPLVLAIPRGGVPMGRYLADALEGELDVVLVRKIRAPGNPEFAIGAISEDGTMKLDAAASHFTPEAVEREAEQQRKLLAERRQRYSPVRPPIPPEGRVVVVVDDGSATGATMEAALKTLHGRAARLVAALGVASPSAVARLEAIADEVVCLDVPPRFMAVGQFYADFGQVEEEEVLELLGE